MNIIRITAFKTNYIWMIYNNTNDCIIIDPGETTTVLNILNRLRLSPKAILLTHNHYDHVAGVYVLIKIFPKITVYGPEETKNQGTNVVVSEGDNFTILNQKITVFNFPGHTNNHIGFYYDSKLFCGDTIFSAGCGKIQNGLTQQMYKSFLKIKQFPDNTLIYSGHEYTLSNINFISSILPNNSAIINYKNHVINLIKSKKSTVPTTLELELSINPFLRCDHLDVKQALHFFPKIGKEWQIFSELRKRKDTFENDIKKSN